MNFLLCLHSVSECSSSCKCPPTCRNRVSSSTVPWRVVLYYFPGKGYGVRAVCDIPKGAFIGMYTGQLLTERDVGRTGRPDTYYFTLTNLNEGNSQDQMKNGTLDYKDLFTLDAQYFGNFTRFLSTYFTKTTWAKDLNQNSSLKCRILQPIIFVPFICPRSKCWITSNKLTNRILLLL